MIFADLIDAMVADFATLPALADVTVCDGPPRVNDPGAYLFVGFPSKFWRRDAAYRRLPGIKHIIF